MTVKIVDYPAMVNSLKHFYFGMDKGTTCFWSIKHVIEGAAGTALSKTSKTTAQLSDFRLSAHIPICSFAKNFNKKKNCKKTQDKYDGFELSDTVGCTMS